MDYVIELADQVERSWKELEYEASAFSDIAYDALLRRPPPPEFDLSEVVARALRGPIFPLQSFPEDRPDRPTLTVFWSERFAMDVHVWRESSTSIHDHGFSGAFCILSGSSLHTQYDFTTTDRVSDGIRLGRLAHRRTEWSRRAEPRRIHSGPGLIHSVFHLDDPTVTLCVRTHGSRRVEPNLRYVPPTLALAMDLSREATVLAGKRTRFVETALDPGDPACERVVLDQLAEADFGTTCEILSVVLRVVHGRSRQAPFLDASRRRHGDRIDALEAAFVEDARRTAVLGCRTEVRSPDVRFLLGLLLELPDRRAIVDFVRASFPEGDPLDRIVGWLHALAREQSAAQAARGDGPGTLDACGALVGERLLRGERGDEVLASILRAHPQLDETDSRKRLRRALFVLPHDPVFRPLFGADAAGMDGPAVAARAAAVPRASHAPPPAPAP